MNIWCVYKFMNVKKTNGGDFIYNSRTALSVGEVATLWGLVLDVFARLIIDKQDIVLLGTKLDFCGA